MALFGLMLGACGGSPATAADAPAGECAGGSVFADDAVEAAVRASLGEPAAPLTVEALDRITQLNVPGARSLGGVECLTNLEGLVAPEGELEDLSPLRGLAHLESVLVERNRVRDLAPLGNLPAIRSIRASDNSIASLAGLTLRQVGCNYTLDLQRNRLPPGDVEPLCALGWIVTWGGIDGLPVEHCNESCL